jgi:hypothetical protein
MSLFTNPVVLNDGVGDRTFNFRGQDTSAREMVGLWVEPAADLAEQSKLVVKHDESSSTLIRRLVQFKVHKPLADGVTYKMITVNFTVAYHPEHDEADVLAAIALSGDAQAESGFASSLLDGFI